jgi:hypothetical protein
MTSPCRSSPAKETASGASAARLPSCREHAHQRHRLGEERRTTTDAPMRALTLTPTPTLTLTPCRSSGGRFRTLQRQPCCCAAVRRRQPSRSDGCASS